MAGSRVFAAMHGLQLTTLTSASATAAAAAAASAAGRNELPDLLHSSPFRPVLYLLWRRVSVSEGWGRMNEWSGRLDAADFANTLNALNN